MLVDIGINLMHRRFNEDREQVVENAAAAGVTTLILTGTSLNNSDQAADYCSGKADLYATAGIHPHEAKNAPADMFRRLRRLAARPEIVAMGEAGLDFNRDFSPRPVQEKIFSSQVELACELKMPLFLHEREAHSRFLAILSSFGKDLPPAVVHCFTGTGEELDAYLAAGYHIGLTGWICDERRGTHLQALVGRIPLERLMLETDAPFITPRDLRPKPQGGRNEPAFLPHILATVARYQQRPAAEVAAATTATAKAFFRI